MPYVLPQWVPVLATLAVCLLTYLRGDRETQIASTYRLAALVVCLATPIPVRNIPYVQTGWHVFDVLVYLVLALRASRYWTLVMASVSLVAFATATMMIWSSLSNWTVGTAQLIWTGLYLLTLTVAACTTRCAASAAGPVRATASPIRSA